MLSIVSADAAPYGSEPKTLGLQPAWQAAISRHRFVADGGVLRQTSPLQTRENKALPCGDMFNHSREKSTTKGLLQPAATKACNRGGGGGPATTRGFDPQPNLKP